MINLTFTNLKHSTKSISTCNEPATKKWSVYWSQLVYSLFLMVITRFLLVQLKGYISKKNWFISSIFSIPRLSQCYGFLNFIHPQCLMASYVIILVKAPFSLFYVRWEKQSTMICRYALSAQSLQTPPLSKFLYFTEIYIF